MKQGIYLSPDGMHIVELNDDIEIIFNGSTRYNGFTTFTYSAYVTMCGAKILLGHWIFLGEL